MRRHSEGKLGIIFPYTYWHFDASAHERFSGRRPGECILVDNSVENLNAAAAFGITPVLFNRDAVPYDGATVYSFAELAEKLGGGTGAHGAMTPPAVGGGRQAGRSEEKRRN